MSLATPFKHLLPPLAASPLQEWVWQKGAFVPIFMLHRIEQPEDWIRGHTVKQLRHQLEWLRRHRWQLLDLNTVLETWHRGEPLPARCAVFTVDDGYWDQYEIAAELFEAYDCPLTYFLITGFLDNALWPWDDQINYILRETPLQRLDYHPYDDGEPVLHLELGSSRLRRDAVHDIHQRLKHQDNGDVYAEISRLYRLAEVPEPARAPHAYRPMRWDQACDLSRRGHALAPHSLTHRILSRLPEAEMEHEIRHSRQVLAERTGVHARVFAYPTGRLQDFGEREMRSAQQLGLDAALSTEPGHAHPAQMFSNARFALPRFSLPTNLADFCQYVSWIEKFKEDWRQRRQPTPLPGQAG